MSLAIVPCLTAYGEHLISSVIFSETPREVSRLEKNATHLASRRNNVEKDMSLILFFEFRLWSCIIEEY
jgi:hypothetical protein